MARGNRSGGFRTLIWDHIFSGTKRNIRRRARHLFSPSAYFKGLEALESRVLLSGTPTLANGVLTCTGFEGQTNTITVGLTSNGSSVVASLDGSSATFATSEVKSLVINAGSRSDSISVGGGMDIPEQLTEGHGATPTPVVTPPPVVTPTPTGTGTSTTGAGTGTSGTGTSSPGSGGVLSNSGTPASNAGTPTSGTGTGSSSTGTGTSSSGTGSSSDPSASTDTTHKGHHKHHKSGTGSGSTGTGTGSTGTGTGTGSTGTTGVGKTGVGSTGTGLGTGSAGSGHTTGTGSGSSSSGTGSSSTGSGSSSSGSGSSSTGNGSSSSGAGSSSTGTGSSTSGTGSSSTGSGSSSTGNGSSSTGHGSSSSGSGSSSSGTGSSSTGNGSSSSGSGSSSTGHGSSSSGGGSSSSGSGSSSTGSGSSSSGSGSSSSGSGSSSSGSGSSSSGSGSTSNPIPTNTPQPTNPNDPSTPSPVITVTSPSDILPLESVNVQAIDSNFGSGTALNSTIVWNFGDPGSSYNELVGFNAAHAYSSPGTYTITATITTPDGHTGVSTTTVKVSNDNRSTIYVSPNGSDSNDGSSENSAIQSVDRLNQLIGSNTRVLFQDGGTYDVGTNSDINLSNLEHVYIGSYGSGAKPTLMYDGANQGNPIIGFTGATGIVIQGLNLDSIFANNDGSESVPDGIDPGGNDITIIGNTFGNLDNDINMNRVPSNILVQDNKSPNPTGLAEYFAWIQGSEIALLGNTVANSTLQADIRVGGADDVEIAFNNFTKTTPAGQSYKNTMTIQQGDYGYVYDNTTTNGPIVVGPIGVDGSPTDASFQNCVIDSNTMNNDSIIINPNAIDTMIRNNVIAPNDNWAISVNSTQIGGGFNWQVQNLWIENNTVDPTGQYGGFIIVQQGEASNIVMDNNLFVDPNFIIGDNQASYVYNSNDDMNSFSEIKDNVWGTPAQDNSWFNGGLFYVGSTAGLQNDWLSPQQWESNAPASGDVYTNVSLGSTFSIAVDGFTAGSSLPNN